MSKKKPHRRPVPSPARRTFRPYLEVLEQRLTPSVSPLPPIALNSPTLAFDPGTESLAILSPKAVTAEVTELSGGVLEVTINGQRHSSNSASKAYDPALAGVNATSLRQLILLDGKADVLTLDHWNSANNLSIHTDGSLNLSGEVSVAGQLTVTAASASVRGATQAANLTVTTSGLLDIEGSGSLMARANNNGGAIAVAAAYFVNLGQVRADGAQGGSITLNTRDYLNSGTLSATGSAGKGGMVWVGFTNTYTDTVAAHTLASGTFDVGGWVTIDGGHSGRLYSSGSFDVTGTTAGDIDLFAQDITLVGASLNASGAAGGGLVRVGGDFHGANPSVPNAQNTFASAATRIRADALQNGLGGRVVLWSEVKTEFDGTITARGGVHGGAGGTIEVSSHGTLNFGGSGNASAPMGKAGSLLLDPKNLVIDNTAGQVPQFNLIDPNATSGGNFGQTVKTLPSGNLVVTAPNDTVGGVANAGAVYLYNGATGALISALTGSTDSDQIGSNGVTVLTNGNYVVNSPNWNNGAGAATFGNGTTGANGIVASSNSLIGAGTDGVDSGGVTALSNGNYVVDSPTWNNGALSEIGAVTWGNGTTGRTGLVSASNSLVGDTGLDLVGLGGVFPLTNGNFVVVSNQWNDGAGAVTWDNGATGIVGPVSNLNSLVGSVSGDNLGSGGVTALTSGNYVVSSPNWNDQAGAATWGSGVGGTVGLVLSTNSLVGSTGTGGSTFGDQVSSNGIVALTNGDYVVASGSWNNSSTNVTGVGAATWGNGATGLRGVVSATNSLVGTATGEHVGSGGVTVLTNGNYVVSSPSWNNGAATAAGAATWGNGATGTVGSVSTANSLVGTHTNDQIASGSTRPDSFGSGVIALKNGNYVVSSPKWNNHAGAATFGKGATGTTGSVSSANSLVGTTTGANGDFVGESVYGLTNGNYVVSSFLWNNITAVPQATQAGAVTLGNGTNGTSGTVSAANSLVGSTTGDSIGQEVLGLSNGNYVVLSENWTNGTVGKVGAATLGNGSTGITGPITVTNSLIGTTANDQVGGLGNGSFVSVALANGNYLVASPDYRNGELADAGALTLANGTTGQTLDSSHTIDPRNSLMGATANSGFTGPIVDTVNGTYLAAFPTSGNGQVVIALTNPNQLTFSRGPSQTITTTTGFLTAALNAGTNVILQANDDITVNSPITETPTGTAGSLTLDAGRSILLNASINTAGGNLTLVANDTKADGLVDSQRDPGNATITMKSGVSLTTGAGSLSVDLKTSTDKTNNGKGAVTLLGISSNSTTLSAASVLGVAINGTSPGDGVATGTYTQTNVTGPLNLNGATLQLTHLTPGIAGNTFTIVHTTGGVSGTFNGLPQGATVTAPDGTPFTISYQANGGKDVVLTQNSAVNNNTLTIQGTGGNDIFTFTAGSPSQYSLDDVSHIIPVGVTSIHFIGNGGNDSATLTGTGSDTATLYPTDVVLTSNGITVDAAGCVNVMVNAGGGNSTANFVTTTGHDTYLGTPTYSAATGSGYSNTALGFTHAHGYAGGANSSATLVTSTGNDELGGLPTYSFVQGATYDSYAIGFAQVAGYAGGTNSVTYMATTATGNDTFDGLPSYSAVSGTGYAVYAVGFARAYGYAGGSNSSAILSTSPTGHDTYIGTPTYSEVSGTAYTSFAISFAHVSAYAGGSNSIAYMSTAGNDNFVGSFTYSEATNGGGYANFAIGFATVVVAANGSNSTADFYDSPGNDTFTGSGTSAILTGSSYYIQGSNFALVRIHSSQGGTDHASAPNVSYTFQELGNWT